MERVLRISALVILAVFVCCGGTANDGPDDAGVQADAGSTSMSARYESNPCGLLTDVEFATITPAVRIAKSESHNVGSATFSPDCRFYLTHLKAEDGTSGTIGLFIDRRDDYELQKAIFKGQPVSGVGISAWQGNGQNNGANHTVGVLLNRFSFRVDTTYEFDYDDLVILAKAVAPRL